MPKKLRAQQIVIDLATETSPVWSHITLQRCIKDSNNVTTQTIDSVDHIYKVLTGFGAQMVQITDPVTQQTVTCSGYGVAALIKGLVIQWIIERHPGTITSEGDLMEAD